MQSNRFKFLSQMALMALLMLALVATGFAHRQPSPASQSLELALAQGLSAEDLCGDAAPAHAHGDPHCLACQIAGAVDLPPLLADIGQDLGLMVPAKVPAPRENRDARPVLDPANRPQAPPAVA